MVGSGSLAEWLAHLERQHPRGEAGIELGLDRIRAVSRRLNQRQGCPVITVGGTNGKGSTCALLERILLSAGYRVGLYTSPHLLRYNERVRVNGVSVDDATLCAAFARVEDARGDDFLTYFEFGTLAAWEVFAAASLDAIILEVGLGGRLDAVNLYAADCAIVTTVALDHTDYLGPTRESIGFEKAGIRRPGRPLICGDADPPRSLAEACGDGNRRPTDSDFRLIGRDFGFLMQEGQWRFWNSTGRTLDALPLPALRGAFQLANAACAIAALDSLNDRLPVSAHDIRNGLSDVEMTGRCQVLPGRPSIMLDVAHNPQAATELARCLDALEATRTTWAVFGMMADKDIAGVVAALASRVDRWLACDLPGPRGATAAQLAEQIAKICIGRTAECFATPAAAFAHARDNAGDDDRILVFGSFLTVADALRSLERTSR